VPALAGPFEDAVAKFANDDFSDTDEAVGTVATSGNPLAFPIISALQEGRLSADPESKKVFVTGATARSSMPPPAPPSDKLPNGAYRRPP
jgi:urea transport system permease protein